MMLVPVVVMTVVIENNDSAVKKSKSCLDGHNVCVVDGQSICHHWSFIISQYIFTTSQMIINDLGENKHQTK